MRPCESACFGIILIKKYCRSIKNIELAGVLIKKRNIRTGSLFERKNSHKKKLIALLLKNIPINWLCLENVIVIDSKKRRRQDNLCSKH